MKMRIFVFLKQAYDKSPLWRKRLSQNSDRRILLSGQDIFIEKLERSIFWATVFRKRGGMRQITGAQRVLHRDPSGLSAIFRDELNKPGRDQEKVSWLFSSNPGRRHDSVSVLILNAYEKNIFSSAASFDCIAGASAIQGTVYFKRANYDKARQHLHRGDIQQLGFAQQ